MFDRLTIVATRDRCAAFAGTHDFRPSLLELCLCVSHRLPAREHQRVGKRVRANACFIIVNRNACNFRTWRSLSLGMSHANEKQKSAEWGSHSEGHQYLLLAMTDLRQGVTTFVSLGTPNQNRARR
jgi:hypothetical protein